MRTPGNPRPARWARLLAPLLLVGAGGCCLYSARGWRGPASEHFDGARFINPDAPTSRRGLLDFLHWRLTRVPEPWPDWVEASPGPPPPRRVGPGELRVTFIGHATVLVQLDGLNVLTDPVWSDAVGPDGLAVVSRRRPPGLRFEDLPPIDLVLISHDHYDHLDMPTLLRLQRAFAPRFAAGLGTRDLLTRAGIAKARDFDWWDSARISERVRLIAVPAQHFSMRGICDRDAVLWTAFVLESPAGRVYFGGDTGYGPHFEAARRRLGPMRLALLPIGAYLPRDFMSLVHLDPWEAVAAHLDLGAEQSLGIHWGTFAQTDEGMYTPQRDLDAALREAGLDATRFFTLGFGEGRSLPPGPPDATRSSGPTARRPGPLPARAGCASVGAGLAEGASYFF
jgi:L-ascorbate metabolism protein UlaG (beta-lactamase superfamily)